MRNSLPLLLTSLLWIGCNTPFSKPVVNVYYIQEANSTARPKVKLTKNHIEISTIKQQPSHPAEKIRLFFVYKPFCPPCRELQRTMQSPKIATLLKEEFIVTMLNIRDTEALSTLGITPTDAPVIYLLNAKHETLLTPLHAMDQEALLSKLHEALRIRDR